MEPPESNDGSSHDPVQTNLKSLDQLKRQAEQRRYLRELRARVRRESYEAAKEEADDAFRSGKYDTSVTLYLRMTKKFGPSCVLYSNCAMAILKSNRSKKFSEAEVMATDALKYEPRNIKARYRRAVARHNQGRHSAAATDLETILQVDPACLDAYKLLQSVDDALMARGDPEDVKDPPSPDKFAHPHDAFPFPNHPALPIPEQDSDTEDCRHKGNGKPCQAYNQDGCPAGPKSCRFSHAPDDRALRDDLGKNVCTLYVLRSCPKSAKQCPFSHDRRLLPSGWWDDGNLVQRAKHALSQGVDVEHLSMLNNTMTGLADQLPAGSFDQSKFIATLPDAIRFAAEKNAKAGVPLWAPGSVPPRPM